MAFKSRFSGTVCCICNEPIYKGQFMGWPRDRKEGEPKRYWHCDENNTPCQRASVTSPVDSHGPVAAPAPIAVPAHVAAPVSQYGGGDLTSELFNLLAEGLKGKIQAQSESVDGVSAIVDQVVNSVAGMATEINDLREGTNSAHSKLQELVAGLYDRVLEVEKKKSGAVSITINDKQTNVTVAIPNAHKQTGLLVKLVDACRDSLTRPVLWPYLWDSTGGGKSHAIKQVAEAMSLPFYAVSFNRQTPAYTLTGYMDATGKFVESAFYKAWKFGGIYCGEELDDGSADLLVTLNVGLANGHMTFANGETVERHKDFVFVGCGNTNGRGASPRYPERKPFDAAFANRFVFVRWEYDTDLELAITSAINPENASTICDWTKAARSAAESLALRIEITPRTSFGLAQLDLDKEITSEMAVAMVTAGIDAASLEKLLNSAPFPKLAKAKKA